MRLKRHSLIRLAWLVLAALLFAQGALAANGCLRPSQAASETVMHDADCPFAQPSAALCIYRFSTDDQSDQQAAIPEIGAGVVPALVVAAPVTVAARSRPSAPARSVDPPIPIRFCSFLI
jgi:hypothetical protein